MAVDPVFVALRGDARAEEALDVIREMADSLQTKVIEIFEKIPENYIVFVGDDVQVDNFQGAFLRATRFRIRDDSLPEELKNHPFVVAVVRTPAERRRLLDGRVPKRGQRSPEESFQYAVQEIVIGYRKFLNGDTKLAAPWRPDPGNPAPAHKQAFQAFLSAAGVVRSYDLTTVMLKYLKEHDPFQAYPNGDSPVVTFLCPHYIDHGVLGGPETINQEKVERVAKLFKQIFIDSDGKLSSMEAFIPTEDLADEPWCYILQPCFWGDSLRRSKLKASEVALRNVMARIQELSGVRITCRPYTEIPISTLRRSVDNPSMPDILKQYLPYFYSGEEEYKEYPPEKVEQCARWSAALYLAAASYLPRGTTVINLEAWTAGWDVVWPFAKRLNPYLNIWWPDPARRQHFK